MLIPSFFQQTEIFWICLVLGLAALFLSFTVATKKFSIKIDCTPEKTWGPYGDCTRNCAGGFKYRTRAIEFMANHGGANCLESDLLQSISCNDDIPCGVNCIPGDPADFQWGNCPPCSKGVKPLQWKTVLPLKEATYMGQDCDIDEVIMVRECEGNIPPCPPDIDCQLSAYAESTCSAPCGSGTKYIFSSISVLPQGDGQQCDLGQLVQQASCYEGSCNCAPFTGTFSECNAACGPGIKVMFRPPGGNPNCPYISITSCEFTPCPNDTCTAPSVDFVQSLCYMQCAGLPFPEIDPQICFSQSILDAVCGGIFNNDCQEPRDCSLSSFSDFSECNATCSAAEPYGGIRTRIRTIVDPGNTGGISCLDKVFIDTEPCNNRVPVSYSAFNEITESYIQSVSAPQCSTNGCSLSAWYSITGFQGGCGACTQVWNRSLTFIGNVDQCPTDPSAYYSVSTCCGKNLNIPGRVTCGLLPACSSCVWDSVNNVSFRCPTIDDGVIYRQVRLLSNSNNPNVDCNTAGFECLYGKTSSGNPYYGNSQFSCSSYRYSCTSGQNQYLCPQGCNGSFCNGNGTPKYSVSNNITVSCECICHPGFYGVACENSLDRCPIASFSQLECNGLGSCSGVCVCDNPFDTTDDCTGSSTSWCWIYGNLSGSLQNSANTNVVETIRKLLGVIPIASTSNYFFSEQDCVNIDTIVVDPALKNSVTVQVVQPLDLYTAPSFLESGKVRRLGLTGKVESKIPHTLLSDLDSPCVPAISTYDILEAAIGPKAKYFIPRYIPFSSPVECESLLTLRTFSRFSSLSQLELQETISGPLLLQRPMTFSASYNVTPTTVGYGYLGNQFQFMKPGDAVQFNLGGQSQTYIFSNSLAQGTFFEYSNYQGDGEYLWTGLIRDSNSLNYISVSQQIETVFFDFSNYNPLISPVSLGIPTFLYQPPLPNFGDGTQFTFSYGTTVRTFSVQNSYLGRPPSYFTDSNGYTGTVYPHPFCWVGDPNGAPLTYQELFAMRGNAQGYLSTNLILFSNSSYPIGFACDNSATLQRNDIFSVTWQIPNNLTATFIPH